MRCHILHCLLRLVCQNTYGKYGIPCLDRFLYINCGQGQEDASSQGCGPIFCLKTDNLLKGNFKKMVCFHLISGRILSFSLDWFQKDLIQDHVRMFFNVNIGRVHVWILKQTCQKSFFYWWQMFRISSIDWLEIQLLIVGTFLYCLIHHWIKKKSSDTTSF